MAYIDKSSAWSVTKEDTYGDKKAPTLPEDGVELINPSLEASTDMIKREVLKNSLVAAQPLLGKETCSGSLEAELVSTTGVAGAKKLNGDLLYESGFGHRIGDVEATSGSVDSAGVITFTVASDCDNYEVGQAIICTGGATTQFAVVRSISAGATMTVSPKPSTDQTDFGGLVSFTIARPEAAQISLAIQEYLEGASRVEYTFGGCVVSDVSVTFPVANIVKANFSVAGAGFSVVEDGVNGGVVAAREQSCSMLNPYVAKNMTFTYDGTAYKIENLDVKVTSDIYDTEALTTDGLTNKTTTGKSEVGGSFGLEYLGSTLFSAFQAGTSGELFGSVSNADTSAVIYAPKVVLTSSAKSKDSGIYKETVNYSCLSSDLCSATSEDAITLAFQ